MSSVDLHTHSGFQRMLPESFAVVCAPTSTPTYVLVLIAHDGHAREHLPQFPSALNDWHAKGLGQILRWAFLRDLSEWWKTTAVLEQNH